MDDYPGDGSEMTGPGIGNEKRGMARTFPRFSLPGAHRLAAKYEFLILEVEAAELNLESTDALPLVASGRAGNDERCRNFSIVCDCLTRVFEGLGRNRVVGTGRDRSEKIVVETAEETQSAQDIRFGNQQQDRVAVEEGSAFQFVDEIAPSRRFIVVVTVLLPECFRIWLVLERSDDSTAIMGVKTKCTKEEQRQKDRYPVYIRRLAARHPRTHRETKCYFGDTFVLHLNQI